MSRASILTTLAGAVCAFLALVAVAPAAPKPEPEKANPPTIDVVLCLDTSNSMDGLIGSAKMRLWDIVNDLAKIKPTPTLRVSLYSYGNDNYDPKSGWVRKESDLTMDLDEISKKLFGLTTRGGTELVARVCRDALKDQKWSTDKNALKLVFVCGNEPASQDKEVTLKSVADLSREMGVVINPIFAGHAEASDAKDWKEFAALAGGNFANIDQDRGTVAIATPMDKELAELSGKLNTTYVMYGKEAKNLADNQKAQDDNAKKVGQQAEATRAQSKASGLYRNDAWDLVDRMKNDPKFDITKVPEAELCDDLKKLKPEERVKYVKEMAAKREEIQKKIADLSKQREEYVRNEAKKNPSKAEKAFDEAIRAAIKQQAAQKGIKIPD